MVEEINNVLKMKVTCQRCHVNVPGGNYTEDTLTTSSLSLPAIRSVSNESSSAFFSSDEIRPHNKYTQLYSVMLDLSFV